MRKDRWFLPPHHQLANQIIMNYDIFQLDYGIGTRKIENSSLSIYSY